MAHLSARARRWELVMLASVLVVIPETARAQATAADDVMDAVTGAYAAYTEGDVEQLSQYFTPDGYSEYPRTGELVRLGLDNLRQAIASDTDRELGVEGIQIEVFGDAAVVTGYRLHRIRRSDGSEDSGRLRLSMMWVNLDGWKLVHLHLSPAND